MDTASTLIPDAEGHCLLQIPISQVMSSEKDEHESKLLAAVPKAHKVLDLTCSNGKVGLAYKSLYPGCIWVGVGSDIKASEIAKGQIDYTYSINIDVDLLDCVGEDYDCVILGDLLQHSKSPQRLLEKLGRITSEDATLVFSISNHSHISVIEQLLMGNLRRENQEIFHHEHSHFLSNCSLFECFLDNGWLPSIVDASILDHSNRSLARRLLEEQTSLNVPIEVAMGNLFFSKYFGRCKKRPVSTGQKLPGSLSVIVPVIDSRPERLDILRSPGLKEIDAEIILCPNATSPAEAFDREAKNASNDWLIICSQDAYFPKNTGHEIVNKLSLVSPENAQSTLIGFSGLGLNDNQVATRAGLVLDGRTTWDHPINVKAISIDDRSLILHRKSTFTIDPTLGWHLWATDLCLQSLLNPEGPRFPDIVRIPIFYNLTRGIRPSHSYHINGTKLSAKYPQLSRIASIVSTIIRLPNGGTFSGDGFFETFGTF